MPLKMRYPAIEAKMRDLCIPKSKVAERLGVTTQTLMNKLSGRSEFSFTEVNELADWWNVSIESLAKGGEEVE